MTEQADSQLSTEVFMTVRHTCHRSRAAVMYLICIRAVATLVKAAESLNCLREE